MCGNLSRYYCCVYTLRSAGAQALTLSPFYRHIAPLERRFLSDYRDFCVFGLLTDAHPSYSYRIF